MCSHLNVKFHRTPNSSQDHRFMTLAISEHSNHFDLITVACVLFMHQQQFKITTRSSERFRPPTFGEVESSRTRTKKATLRAQLERTAELGCVVVSTQYNLYSETRVRRRTVMYATFHTLLGRESCRLVPVLSPFPACHVALFLQRLVG